MTDLTEQWKKGELINGKKYYITFFDSEPFEATFRAVEAIFPFWKFEANGRQYCDENGYDCIKVLAPVPSYEEYQQLLSDQLAKNEGVEINAELETENTKLKDLLKSALSWLPDGSKLRGMRYAQLQSIKRKIAQVLGEE